ncbi:c-type cytochrome [bacterium]|nr:c-type cytochrome [bacterium]
MTKPETTMRGAAWRPFAAAGLAAALGACALAPAAERAGDPAEGLKVAQAQCAACHSVGASGTSPVAAAKPFRFILSTYNPNALEADLKNAVRVGHMSMPQFYFSDAHVEDLLAYLSTIQTRESDQ